MAAPVASKIILADDTSNDGKNARTQTRVVGADTVHEHFFVPVCRRSKLGVYYYASTVLSIQIAASSPQDGINTGFWWIINPSGSGVTVLLKELLVRFTMAAVLAEATGPRVIAQKFAYTGTASGAQVTPCKRKATDASPGGSVRTAVTGMTCTLGATLTSFLTPAVLTGVGAMTGDEQVWPHSRDPLDEDAGVELAPTEGVVIYQADAGTATTDNRRLVVNATIEEFE